MSVKQSLAVWPLVGADALVPGSAHAAAGQSPTVSVFDHLESQASSPPLLHNEREPHPKEAVDDLHVLGPPT
jgi:ribulose kinase